ncbi:tetratricopeptide repeat protein [Angustibacter luteus]|uniref:Tetratricopeptide repeat protein n=1 Tax=Angustibacter luteus TaxID=658456 RepID=A0ABW1JF72_9ACTN
MVVATAGYGKTTALESEAPAAGLRRQAVDLVAGPLPDAPWLGIDDLDVLSAGDRLLLLERLAALPDDVGFTLTARCPLDDALLATLPGPVLERGPQDLRLSTYQVAGLLAQEYGVQDPAAAGRVHAATAGWPMLVHFAADLVAREPDADVVTALAAPGTASARWVTAQVLAYLEPAVRDALRVAAALGPFTARLLENLSPLGSAAAAAAVDRLCRSGVLVARQRPGGLGLTVVVPVVAQVLAAATRSAVGADKLVTAARSYQDDDLPFPAARAWQLAGDLEAARRMVEQQGAQMLAAGHAAGVVALLDELGATESTLLQRTRADALRMVGDTAGALRAYAPLVERADRDGWDAALSGQVAAVHYACGEPRAALVALDRISADAASGDRDGILWRACRAQVLATLGRDDEAVTVAAQAVSDAEAGDDKHAAAEAHSAMARVCRGSQKEAHLERALDAATSAGDALAAMRVRVNQSCLALAAARYGQACTAAREAVRLGELGSPPGRYAVALHNLGEALLRVGEYGEATWQLQRSVAMFRGLGPGRCGMGLVGLGEVHRELGHDEQARAAYLEAVDLGRDSGELQVLVPALAGLARLRAADDPDEAYRLADEAVRGASASQRPFAHLGMGWVHLVRGDRADAAIWAGRAVESARDVHALDVLAEALELTAAATDDPALAHRALGEALAIWRDGGATTAEARVELLIGWQPAADGADRSRARDAARRLQRLGILHVHGRPVTDQASAHQVTIQVLGGFTVGVGGAPVPFTAWRSRQARTLVKVLAARRGRPVSRASLCELLWPDDDPAKTAHRLSVLLATVRGVLDPGRDWPAEHYVGADPQGIRLDLAHVALDADALVHDADAAAALMDAGERERAREILTDVDGRYRGGALEDELGEEWADGFREEVRAAWLRSLRRLAWLHAGQGRPADAQVLLVRLLDADPYDTNVHRLLVTTLVRGGRHGEARRAFARWAEAMDAVDAPPPDDAVLGSSGLGSGVLTPR